MAFKSVQSLKIVNLCGVMMITPFWVFVKYIHVSMKKDKN